MHNLVHYKCTYKILFYPLQTMGQIKGFNQTYRWKHTICWLNTYTNTYSNGICELKFMFSDQIGIPCWLSYQNIMHSLSHFLCIITKFSDWGETILEYLITIDPAFGNVFCKPWIFSSNSVSSILLYLSRCFKPASCNFLYTLCTNAREQPKRLAICGAV